MTQKIYMGPTVHGVANENMIFKDKLPDKVQKKAQEDVNFKRLLVPMDKAMDARKELETEGSALYVAYESIKKGE